MTPTLSEVAAPDVQGMIDQMVEVAETVARGPLTTIHQRELPDGIELQLRDALAPYTVKLLRVLAGPNAYIQTVPNVRVHRHNDPNSVVPFHSDVLYGHSPDEVNYWVNLTPAFESNSLWLCDEAETATLHRALREERLSLNEFEELARQTAKPIFAPDPGVETFCCARVHGSVLNQTDSTRVSLDLRMLNTGTDRVKKRGGYFRPVWLPELDSPLAPGTPITTVATLDDPTPVYLQRIVMEHFYPQAAHAELVEFYDMPYHSPTLTEALSRGPVLAYTIKQLREIPTLTHPIGFANEKIWVTQENIDLLDRLIKETN
jgi:hypothetical protein